jgi:hypothetical protein
VGGSRNKKKSAVGFLIQRSAEVFALEHGFDALEIFFQENKVFLDLGILHVLEVQDPEDERFLLVLVRAQSQKKTQVNHSRQEPGASQTTPKRDDSRFITRQEPDALCGIVKGTSQSDFRILACGM